MWGLTSVEAVLSLANQVASQPSAPEPASIALLGALRASVFQEAAKGR